MEVSEILTKLKNHKGEPVLVEFQDPKPISESMGYPIHKPNGYILGVIPLDQDAYLIPQSDSDIIIPTPRHAYFGSFAMKAKVLEGAIEIKNYPGRILRPIAHLPESMAHLLSPMVDTITIFVGDEEIVKSLSKGEFWSYYDLARSLGIERSTESLRKRDDEFQLSKQQKGIETITPLLENIRPKIQKILEVAEHTGIPISPQTPIAELLDFISSTKENPPQQKT